MTIEAQIGILLIRHKMTLAVAESCTGGLVGNLITNISGSSEYFLGGIIAYNNSIKTDMLGVKKETIERFGAVSEETAKEMAKNVQEKFCSDIGLSITGIAGPSGGSPEKPVGLTYIGVAIKDIVIVRKFIWRGDRIENKQQSANAALEIIKKYGEVYKT
ncbi:MAG TPA: CinA family protein [Candidatus Saccharimonadales bacterium]|nr:CinA family protein [Candidatus Saccharimonadales bacterium]